MEDLMSPFPNSPRLIKAGLVLVDPQSAQILKVITLQYNPDQLSRTLAVQGTTGEGDRSDALRLKGPPVETIKLEAFIDATDHLATPADNPEVLKSGIHPQLAALETIVYPSSQSLQANAGRARIGLIEIAPMQAPLTLLVWSKQRIVPVRITEFSITEEAFDTALNPIRAKVSLGLRVLSVDDLGFDHKGGGIYMSYLAAKEQLVRKAPKAEMSSLGIEGLP
jgi:Contractile injection system tube protein